MRYIHCILCAAVFLGVTFPKDAYAENDPCELVVYTYDSFSASWGAGPGIAESFEAQYGCAVRYVGLVDGVAIASRLSLEGKSTKADLVLGIDDAISERLRAHVAPHRLHPTYAPTLKDFHDHEFVAYDHGWFAFVHRAGTKVPDTLAALPDSQLRIIIQDPRTSTPGLGLVAWVKQVQGDAAPQWWQGLRDNIVTVTQGWSEAYGLFLKGEADVVLSYTTSPAYHSLAEADDGFRYAAFREGHLRQIELAAIVISSRQPQLAKQFLMHLLSPEVQASLVQTQWMYPAIAQGELPAVFQRAAPQKSLSVSPKLIHVSRREWIREWQKALR